MKCTKCPQSIHTLFQPQPRYLSGQSARQIARHSITQTNTGTHCTMRVHCTACAHDSARHIPYSMCTHTYTLPKQKMNTNANKIPQTNSTTNDCIFTMQATVQRNYIMQNSNYSTHDTLHQNIFNSMLQDIPRKPTVKSADIKNS